VNGRSAPARPFIRNSHFAHLVLYIVRGIARRRLLHLSKEEESSPIRIFWNEGICVCSFSETITIDEGNKSGSIRT